MSGSLVNVISGLHGPQGLAVSGSNLFVVNQGNGTISEYTTSGAVVNASLISGLSSPGGIAIADVPEPSSLALLFSILGMGAFGLCAWAWRRNRKTV
jgi:hypothetical protein